MAAERRFGDVAIINRPLTRKVLGQGRCVVKPQQRVKDALLRTQVPDPCDLQDSMAAQAILKEAAASSDGLLKVAEVEKEPSKPRSEWDRFQERILRNFEFTIRQELGPDTTIRKIHPNESVKHRFLDTLRRLDHTVSVGYHGTALQNIDCISRQGLRKPGNGGIKVVHGSAHGVGIYTAKLGSASLSKGFASGHSQLFICAICDTSAVSEPVAIEPFVPSKTVVMTRFPKIHSGMRHLRGHRVLQESKEVLHVGDAMVVFEEDCVVPVLIADFHGAQQTDEQEGASGICWSPPQQVGRRRLAIPEPGQPGIVFAEPGKAQRGRTVWITPSPKENATAQEKRLRRRLNAKRRDKQFSRKNARLQKHADLQEAACYSEDFQLTALETEHQEEHCRERVRHFREALWHCADSRWRHQFKKYEEHVEMVEKKLSVSQAPATHGQLMVCSSPAQEQQHMARSDERSSSEDFLEIEEERLKGRKQQLACLVEATENVLFRLQERISSRRKKSRIEVHHVCHVMLGSCC
eukprot:TRINITY_DN7006_c0_g1_i2.p1 TRINITY_DN7006_c0_g1~~TRINITY_DN7006_c0_g1_i2.p1  ORF type:complete len:523 (-),score=114.49 TRINITY_DN7006_c0_g1_i2:44-1612(-)